MWEHVRTPTCCHLLAGAGALGLWFGQTRGAYAAEGATGAGTPESLVPTLLIISVVVLGVVTVLLRREMTRRVLAEHGLQEAAGETHRQIERRAREIAMERMGTLPLSSRAAKRLASVSHDLRTPLNAIVGWAEILKIDTGANRVRAIEAIERNAFIESRLIAELLEAPTGQDAARPEAESQPVAIAAGDQAEDAAADLNLHVLIVEDDADAATTLRTLLEQRGCDVRVARSMSEGLAAYATARPDVLLCDIGLPDGDGYTLLRTLRAEDVEHPVPAIALSAAVREGERARAAAAGFAVYVTKPYRLDELLRHVRHVYRTAPQA
jgi:CheY-like chemotaxis protein